MSSREVQTCSAQECDGVVVAHAVIALIDGKERAIGVCKRHLPLVIGGTVWQEMLKADCSGGEGDNDG